MNASHIKPGIVLDHRFRITEEVASGGMGTVFRARDLLRDGAIALKVLFGRDHTALQRFEREAQLLADLSHPGIVRYVAHGVLDDGAPYLAMEWLTGEDLAVRLARQPLTLLETIELGIAVASALEAAHSRGVIHRDIKPANLFLPDGEIRHVKLLDFGIARLGGASDATRTGTVIGTPDYMAPEQVRGEREIDGRADLFSLGCLLFECLIGHPPFASNQMMGVFAKILFEPAPDLRSLRAELPMNLSLLVASLLEKDRGRRPARAAEVLSALQSIPLNELSRPRSEQGPASRPRALTTHEQRLMSIVVVAVQLPISADAPTVSVAPTDNISRMLRDIGTPFGARTEYLPDGSLVALLTGQLTASDQARQSARLALRIRERWQQETIAAADQTASLPPQLIAVCMGRGDIERGVLDAGSIERALGLIARRRQSLNSATSAELSRPSILLDEMTRGFLDAHFVTDTIPHALGAMAQLVDEQPIDEPVRLVLGRSTPFFGREREMALLSSMLHDCIEEPRARVLLVTAEAGLGKSRLCQEFLRRATAEQSELTVWLGRGDPLSAGSPFGLLAKSLRRALNLPEGEPGMAQHRRLCAYLEPRLPAADSPRVSEFIGELLDVVSDRPTSQALEAARLDAMLMGDQIRRAVLDFLTAECKARPLLWVLEDLQWGDLPTIHLIDTALRQLSEQPLLVLALARPSVHETFPRLWSERNPQEIRLSGLSRKASEKIARAVLGNTGEFNSVIGLLERAQGNAFFLEEMLRAAAAGQLQEGSAPATVLAMVQSRIERLEPEARRVLRAACVFGSVFWRGGVAMLLGDGQRALEVQKWLDVLADRELVARRPESRLRGEAEYTVVHALIRDAAYAMLTDADRRLGHRLAAQFLEQMGERDAVSLAEHWERGGELSRAGSCYRRAAWQALEGNDFDAVLRHAERAIGCGLIGEDLGELRAAQAEAYLWRGVYQKTCTHAHLAMAALPERSPRWFQMIGALAISAGRLTDGALLDKLHVTLEACAAQGETSDAFLIAAVRTGLQAHILGSYPNARAIISTVQRIVARTNGPRAPGTEAVLYLMRSNQATVDWQLDLIPRHLERAAELFDEIGDQRNACSQRLDAAFYYLDIGEFARAAELTGELITVAERLGMGRLSSVSLGAHASALFWMQRYDEAEAVTARALAQGQALGDRRISGACEVQLARLGLIRGDLAFAEKHADAALVELAEMPRFRARALAVHAQVMLRSGRIPESLRSATQGYGILQALGRLGTDETLVRVIYVELLQRTGKHDLADEILRVGRERLMAQTACITDRRAQERFLALPDNASFLQKCQERPEAV